jgi:hypothetical protein
MSTFAAHKVVSALPATLAANAIYAVRVGAGFDLYITDSTGLVAHKVNDTLTWDQLVFWPSTAAGTATVSGQAGDVRTHTKGGVSYHRFIPSDYSEALDGFYTTYTGGVLSGLVASRG